MSIREATAGARAPRWSPLTVRWWARRGWMYIAMAFVAPLVLLVVCREFASREHAWLKAEECFGH